MNKDWIADNFKSFNRRIFNIKSVDQLGAYLAIFLFVHYVIKSVLEYLMENSNLKLTKLTRCITNIVESTILFSIILGKYIVQLKDSFFFRWLSQTIKRNKIIFVYLTRRRIPQIKRYHMETRSSFTYWKLFFMEGYYFR